MSELLSIQNLQIDFTSDGVTSNAVQDVSVEVQRGEIVAIVGESGSGKSVTALSILQLLPSPPAVFSKGEIWFTEEDGRKIDLLKASNETIRKIRGNEIAMIFQEPMTSLNPVHTCGHQVMEAIVLHQKISGAEAKKKTIELFESVQLPNPPLIYNRYPHQLSGGQKQRVMIAMAMSCNPSLLICDEPTTALDVTVQKTILQLIKNLQQQKNMGVIFISHDLGVVAEVADKVIVMYKGQIVEEGAVGELYKNPTHPYTKALLACRPALHVKGERLPIVSDFIDGKLTGVHDKLQIQELPKEAAIVVKTHPLLLVQKLKVWFPGKTKLFGKQTEFTKAVNDVSFDVFEGETVGLVGESGCGKSTLGRSILQLIRPTAGSILFKGQDLAKAPKDLLRSMRKDMQIIFQDPYSSLNPRMTVGEAIGEPIKVHGLAANNRQKKEKVIELLEKVHLRPEHYNRYPHEFSGGQRQRIVIARALALHPAFVICDESVSALDVSVQAQVLNLLNDLKKEFKFTSIFISHDLSVVRYISDRIMVMNKGEIVETGGAEELYLHPTSTYTQNLIASIPKGIVA
ncbi:ABC transporter ATP-binding protein [Segetibacter aerophilus]|uniref:ABC transporter ATP-binding protein n=1 Tax=Segetibacter aerophilus TaxID=670293 RepID=A0A512BII5_9BACT|nr:ABC transporter ATP-binding protein [Segetibacter aerophilus]GEO11675.1 ABC transporter ATP-binding protein [Segetibacter aerophilus]